jgi:hypothetical protein
VREAARTPNAGAQWVASALDDVAEAKGVLKSALARSRSLD